MEDKRVILKECGMNFTSFESSENEKNSSRVTLYLSFKLDNKSDNKLSVVYNGLKLLFAKAGYIAINTMKEILSTDINGRILHLNIKQIELDLPSDIEDFFLDANISVTFEADEDGMLFYNAFSDKQTLSEFIINSFNDKINKI